MARESTVTFDQVVATADTITAAGGKATARTVRERLGTGSMGTVQRFIQQWKDGQSRPIEATLTLPPALQRSILDFMAQEIASVRATVATELVEQQQAVADLATENERLAETIDIDARTIRRLTAENATAEGRISELTANLTEAHAEAAHERRAAEQARTENAKALLRLEAVPAIEAEVQRLRQQLEEERQARHGAEVKMATLDAQLTAAGDRANKAEADATNLQKDNAALTRELTNCNLAVQAGQTRLESAERELNDAKTAVEKARQDAKTAGELAAELRGKMTAKVTAKMTTERTQNTDSNSKTAPQTYKEKTK